MEVYDWSKLFLFMVLSLVVFVLISDKRRPLASAPLEPSSDAATSQTLDDRSLISRGPGWAGVASNGMFPPYSLAMPVQGRQPTSGDGV